MLIASKDQVSVFMNDGTMIPREGLCATASTVGGREGPFEIVAGVNDKFAVSFKGGSYQVVTLFQGLRVAASDIVSFLNSSVSGVRFSTVRGRIRAETVESGDSAYFFLGPVHDSTGAPIGTAHDVLGLPNNFEVRGRTVIPPWVVEATPNTVNPSQPHRVRFVESIPATSSYFELSYYTKREFCCRCRSVGWEYDFAPDDRGDLQVVEGADLLLQMVEKVVLTTLGSDLFASTYGTTLANKIGTKAPEMFKLEAYRQITQALSQLQSMQVQQSRVQEVSDAEFLEAIDGVSVEQSVEIPELFMISIAFHNRSRQPLSVTRLVQSGSGYLLFDPMSQSEVALIEQ
jgi:phage baseplate assembly protein W